MSKRKKLLNKLISRPKDFRYSELSSLLKYFGYKEIRKGKTSGSRVAFVNEKNKHIIRLHKPHPKEILKLYQIDYLIDELEKERLL